MSEEIELSIDFKVPPRQVYNAWLDSEAHGQFTGSKAEIDPRVGGDFTAWDGYIWGKTLALDPPQRILQSWRTSEFPPESPDSLLEIFLDDSPTGTRLTLRHTEIPDGQGEQYREGWIDYYFKTMTQYFHQQTSYQVTNE